MQQISNIFCYGNCPSVKMKEKKHVGFRMFNHQQNIYKPQYALKQLCLTQTQQYHPDERYQIQR